MVVKQSGVPRHERAVVIGASMAGLSVARGLAGHFRQIVLIERDTLSRDRPEHRPGVPQSWHIHNMMLGGQRELEGLFPGFAQAADELGAMQVDDMADIAIYAKYGWVKRVPSEFVCMSATRTLMEFAVRQRFFELVRNARLLTNTRVKDLLFDAGDGQVRVVGVATDHPEEPTIEADLVVDCGGRNQGWKAWFKRHAVPLPDETVVDSHCGYSSRFYRPNNPAEFSWKAMIVDPAFPERPNWGVIIPLENNDWVVTLGGFNGKYPPADEQGFLDFARKLPTPEYARALERADPITKVRAFRRLEMRWNHFESFDGPLRFLAVGDSAWKYNPLYGQGMSVAATCARILRDELNRNNALDGLPRRYYAAARKFAQPVWTGTAQLDMRWPGASGKRAWHSGISNPASEMALRAASHDKVVGRALLSVAHLVASPAQAGYRPNVVARILWYALKAVFTGPPKVQDRMQPPPPGREIAPPSFGEAACCACSERPCCCQSRPMLA